MGVVAHQPLTENKMKVLAVLLLSGLAAGGGVGNNDWKMFSRWSTMKAQESCLGEENMKIHTVNLTAIAKCYQKDAPELNLPPFNSPYRFINTLMTSADSMEHSQLMDLFKMYKMMQTMRGHDSSSYMPSMFNDQHYGAKPYSMDHTNKSWMEKMFEKTMMNNYDSDINSNQYKDMFDFDSSDMYESQSNLEKMMDAYGSKMNEDKMMENMMMYKMQQMQRSNDESSYNPFNKNTYRERMAALLQRHKRQAPKKPENAAVTLPENLDLGDRLADKLKQEQIEMEQKIGNMTCVMREIGVLIPACTRMSRRLSRRTLDPLIRSWSKLNSMKTSCSPWSPNFFMERRWITLDSRRLGSQCYLITGILIFPGKRRNHYYQMSSI